MFTRVLILLPPKIKRFIIVLKMSNNFIYFSFVTSIVIFAFRTSVIQGKGQTYVTYGSSLRLVNTGYKVRLHSHELSYITGSGQQSVTGTSGEDDENTYWLVKAGTKKQCTRGAPVKCGDIIRLEHMATKKNLHSHSVHSPLSGKQEISAFGDGKGEGDNGDNWHLICDTEFWMRDKPITLQHVDTQQFLAVSGRVYGEPIVGHSEIVGEYSSDSPHVQWMSAEGVYIHFNDFSAQHQIHTEL